MKKHLFLAALCSLAVLSACEKEKPVPTPGPEEEETVTSLDKPVVRASASGATVTVSWDQVKDAKEYLVDYRKASETDFTTSPKTNLLNYTVSGLEYSTEYVFRVQAVAGSVKSEWSEEISATTEELKISYPLTISDAALFAIWINEYASVCKENDVVKLGADINLNGVDIVPVAGFDGTFDGAGKSIRNWAAAGPLFAEVSGTVKDLNIDASCSLNAGDSGDIALIAGHLLAGGKISGCTNAAPINREESFASTVRLGAIVGFLEGNISGCTNSGAITLKMTGASSEHVIGGVAGYLAGEPATGELRISDCHNTAPITLSYTETPGKTFLGGVLGASIVSAFKDKDPINIGTIKGCSNSGVVDFSIGVCNTGTYGNVGGVVGYFEGNVEGCNNTGDISYVVPGSNPESPCTRPCVGGVAGYVAFSMTDCINNGGVTIKGAFANAGGLERGAGADLGVLCGGVAGGVSGREYSDASIVSGCRNTGKIDIDICQPAANSTGADLGGVVGFCNMPMKDCVNAEGEMPIPMNIKSTARWTRAGGVVGYHNAGNLTGCSNAKAIVFDANCPVQNVNCSQQISFGGVIGHHHTHKYTIGDCTNTGDITFKNGWHNVKGASYVGGILGSRNGNSGHVMEGCRNTGTVCSESSSYMMVGGLCGDLYGELRTSVNEGNVKVSNAKANGVYISEIGGLLGYSVCNLEGNTNSGAIDVKSSDVIRIGGFCGGAQYVKVWAGDTLSCAITADNTCYAGAFIGAVRAGSVTLGTAENPEIVTPDASVLGAKVSSENYIGGTGTLIADFVTIK